MPDLRHHLACRYRTRRPPAERNNAEGAAVVAAILYLHIGAGARAEAVDQMTRGLSHGHNVVDHDLFGIGVRESLEGPALGLLPIADDVIDLLHAGEEIGIDLGGAAGHHDLGAGVGALRLPDRLPRLAHGFARHRAGV